ncbi:uncharacterized protein LOC105440533 [Strongylocentrotus purpuratus]|uniref:SKI/SNO/DAC domain-containing protein n=1 Tax=Strongylocentrotus purpuratus TaxID=7668 RepID=A0A7M7P3V2_STRPU|nr:uncharacterized protein LOC105440533 [Strongylocentrotus purpuratus]
MKINLSAKTKMEMRNEFAELNGIRLAILQMRAGNGGKNIKMYALTQVFQAFQNGRNSVPRTTFHKRLKKLHIDRKPCKLRQIHRLKWLKAVPHRTSKCCLISHDDLLKLCRSCGVKTEGLANENGVKINLKTKHKKHTKNVKKREKKIKRECTDATKFELGHSGRSDRIIECQNLCNAEIPNASKSDIFFARSRSADSDFCTQHVRSIGNTDCKGTTCKQIGDSSGAEHVCSNSTTKSVEFSFSEPCIGFQACERKTVTFDIHSTAFSTADRPLIGAGRANNMRGEVDFDCGEKEGTNMDDNDTTDTCNPIATVSNVSHECDMHSETNITTLKGKEYFGFTGQEKEDNSWQSFGNVPDQDGAAILENTEESNGGEVRFVNGFQFADAAQQIRVGCMDLESDSDQESELSNLEINSNLSDLSELSVSSESLDSVSSTDTSVGELARVRWRARVGSNSDGESECTTSLCSPARFIHGAKPCRNNKPCIANNCGQLSSDTSQCNSNNLWSQHSAMYVKKINNSLRLKDKKCSTVQEYNRNCQRNIQRGVRGNHESEQSRELSYSRNSPEVVVAGQGEHQDSVAETKSEICQKRKRHGEQGDPKKVAELKRKLEAISSELARLQKGKAKKSIGKGAHSKHKKTRRLKPKKTHGGSRIKRSNNRGLDDPKTATFKMSEFLLLPPSLVVRDGDLKPACSMAVPRGVHPPKCHPVWRWKIGGSPLPKPNRHKVLQHGVITAR